jgi:hypothetical protein
MEGNERYLDLLTAKRRIGDPERVPIAVEMMR